jgi:NAD(P)-dependent dehydrogenase (short-subunit alcohol dehydrogenase family)
MAKAVLVTGASGGIGRTLVRHLSCSGWSVIGTDHPDAIPTPDIKNLCKAWIPLDLLSLNFNQAILEDFKQEVLKAADSTGLASIVHNAAIQRLNLFCDLTSSDWNQTFQVNLFAPVFLNRIFIPQLILSKGSIVHIGSIHSRLTKSRFTAYATSKAALAGLTRAMAVELGGKIRVNAIEPAAIATEMLQLGFAGFDNFKDKLDSFHPTGKIGNPEDVAHAVLFLINESNKYINGCLLELGGGIHNSLHDPF